MAERHSWAVQQVAGVGVQTVEDARHSIGALWLPASGITNRSGLVPSGTTSAPGSALATTPTPNTFVHVQPFRFVLQSVRGGGVYVMCLDAIKDIDILNPVNGGTAADPSNARIDLIIAQQNDVYFFDANSDMVVKRVGGTASGSPVDPTVTGSTDYVLLARVTVPAGATTIQTANIASVALPSAVAVGGILPVGTTTVRDALTNPYDGMPVYRRDVDWVEVYDGAAWRAPAFCRTTALANITSPFTGQIALLTTDNFAYRWNGSAWAAVASMAGDAPRGTLGASSTTSGTGVTTSDVIQPETVTVTGLVTGRRVEITHTRSEAGASNILNNRYRVQAGASLVLGSSTLISSFASDPPGSFRTTTRTCTWVSTITGQATFGLSSFVNGGTGSVDSGRTRDLLIKDIGL